MADRPHGKRPQPPQLTAAELRVLAALEDLIDELGYAPTYAQMLRRLGWSPNSKGSLHQYLNRLRALGVVEGAGRSLRVRRRDVQNDRTQAGSQNEDDAG